MHKKLFLYKINGCLSNEHKNIKRVCMTFFTQNVVYVFFMYLIENRGREQLSTTANIMLTFPSFIYIYIYIFRFPKQIYIVVNFI